MKNEAELIRYYASELNKLAFKLTSLLRDIDITAKQRQEHITLMTPRRRKPREGCIIQRGDGRYEGRYMQGGKQRSVYAHSYDDCYSKLSAAIEARDKAPTNTKQLLPWLTEYVETYKRGEVATETYKAMLRNIRLHIQPYVPVDIVLAEVKPLTIQQLLNSVASVRTRESVYNLLSGAFRQAVAERLIEYNPMTAVKRVKAKREKGLALTVEEQSEFLRAIHGSVLEYYYLFCLYSGCRRNEALAVTWSDIDEENKTIHIRGTKTAGSDRFIPLFDTITFFLRHLDKGKKLFDFKPDYVSHEFKKYCPNHCLHDLRHTFATRALEAEIPLKVVQVWLGHSEIGTTADIYSDVSRELSLTEAAKLDKSFSKKLE